MEFFAGANTKNGFYSIFEEVFSDSERLYIIKGSCGCGKSTLMKKIALRAEELGLAAERIFCSGDPDSLDGVIIPERGVAFCDGTAPHVMEVKYPCVRESIWNLGAFHNAEVLLPHRSEIIGLTDKKSAHYAAAYRALAAAGKLRSCADSLVYAALDLPAINRFAEKTVKKAGGGDGKVRRLFASAFTKNGLKVLPAFGKADTLVSIKGPGAAPDVFLRCAAQAAADRGQGCFLSLSATDAERIDSVYFPGSGTLFTSLKNPPCAGYNREKIVTLARFADKEICSGVKNRVRLLKKAVDAAEQQAMAELGYAADAHRRLEKIYISGTDFDALDEYSERLIGSIGLA